jgi:DNA-binding CsgD family transcriptional regulator
MHVTLSPGEQSAFRQLFLANHDASTLVPVDAAVALSRLLPCDVIATGEGDAQGYVLRGGEYPAEILTNVGPQVCDGPWNTGLEHFARFPHDHPDLVAAQSFGGRDALRLGFATSRRTVVTISFINLHRDFTARDVAILTMLEPALGRLLKDGGLSASAPALTIGETRVLERIARGLGNREAAEDLYVSESTVRKHLQNAYRKLGVSSRTGALAALSRSAQPLGATRSR